MNGRAPRGVFPVDAWADEAAGLIERSRMAIGLPALRDKDIHPFDGITAYIRHQPDAQPVTCRSVALLSHQ